MRLKSLERLSTDHIVGSPFFALHARTFLSQSNIFASARIGNFDDARRSNADANACETRRSERNVCITSNDASIVVRDVRAAPRGVAQIDRNNLRHVIGELTVFSKTPVHAQRGQGLFLKRGR